MRDCGLWYKNIYLQRSRLPLVLQEFQRRDFCKSLAKLSCKWIWRSLAILVLQTENAGNYITHVGRADVECSKGGLKEDPVFYEFSR
jgi:hypothetical protein